MKIESYFAMVALILVLYGCATVPRGVEKPRWSCDVHADEAVDKGDLEEALTRHQALVAAEPNNCLALYHLGYVWGQLGDRSNEVAGYERAIACGYDQDDRLFFNMGMACGELDQPEKAVACLERAVSLKPENPDNYFGLGLAARLAGDTDQACRAFSKAVEIDPRNWDARIELARLLLDQTRLDQARIQLETIEKGAPEHPELETLWRIYNDRKITSYER